ncbi:class I SAM-dependent methyltransferase [Pedobacter cryoconitis]|uniref:SAM-dependent methyltransferase n=1 Tax=Pedobacter cryoconitis TaxID=188932 RepID=A0A7X0J4K8_9SPHI|nr:class I SAM-dependent methyltransferase [Pedobacter cryoconitis]MBB6501036.1 SAM-dependent methyltransferase [Pedobacter cryoconitis]
MKQNKYDDPQFFANYSLMPRSVDGLNAAGEWHTFRDMLPTLQDKKVLDLGCGFGWHCLYAREQQARAVVGVDLSENMLARARKSTDDPAIEYHQLAIEDINFTAEEFDVVISSLAFHYVENFAQVCQKVGHSLQPGGSFVFSVEHPVFTAMATQDWYYDENGKRLHWPVDGYQQQGQRIARFLDHDVVKYHRTIESYLNDLIDSGFRITRISEPQPSQEVLDKHPEMQDETRRPIFLMIAAVKDK